MRAGFASADIVQAFPLVGTVWATQLLGEFRGAARATVRALVGAHAAYALAVVLVAASALLAPSAAVHQAPPS